MDSAQDNQKKNKERVKPPNGVLTVAEVADRLWIDRSSARRLIVSGQIPSFTVMSGRRKHVYRVRPEVLDRWIAAKEREGQRARASRQIGNNYRFENEAEFSRNGNHA
jgi:excisionase family DNA binding protein